MIQEQKIFVPAPSFEADITLYTSDDFPIYLNEETKICLTKGELLQLAKGILQKGVNIGMQNVKEARWVGDYNFDQDKAIQESKDYINSLNIK